MITLNASGGSITFTFDGNSTYLNDGTITVPVNSLALIIDESDMVTFKKSQSSDIFVSANITEFGMTKAELESWYKENAVGEVGGGVDSGTVQTMIDESISGKANSSDVYTTGQTSGATEIANALNAKLDTTAYTPVQVSTAITENDTNPVAGGAVYDKVHVTSGESSETVLIFEEITVGGHKQTLSTNYPSGATIVKLDINNIPSYAGYLEWFGADGSVLGGAKITQDGGNVGVNFNHPDLKAMSGTASYTDNVLTVEVTGFQNASLSDIAYFFHDLASTYNSIKAVKTAKEYWIKDYVDAALSGKADSSAVTEEISAAVSGKQDTLSAGTGIEISGNVISATGGGSSNLSISAGTGTDSIIVGSKFNEASGAYSVAQGEWTKASGGTSHAEGTRTKSYGIYSHAEGSYSEASGSYSHAEGDSTYATAQASHSEGQGTSATSMSSHSEGRYTQANGMGSHSEGYYTIAENEYEHASGKFNASNTGESTSAQTLFSVGNGGWDETLQENVRHNAFEIRKNGDIYFFDGTNDVKLQDVISNILNRLTTIENNS